MDFARILHIFFFDKTALLLDQKRCTVDVPPTETNRFHSQFHGSIDTNETSNAITLICRPRHRKDPAHRLTASPCFPCHSHGGRRRVYFFERWSLLCKCTSVECQRRLAVLALQPRSSPSAGVTVGGDKDSRAPSRRWSLVGQLGEDDEVALLSPCRVGRDTDSRRLRWPRTRVASRDFFGREGNRTRNEKGLPIPK